MDQKTLKAQLLKLSKQVGTSAVCSALISNGLSPRQADLLSMGDHKGAFRRKTVSAVEAVIAQFRAKKAS